MKLIFNDYALFQSWPMSREELSYNLTDFDLGLVRFNGLFYDLIVFWQAAISSLFSRTNQCYTDT